MRNNNRKTKKARLLLLILFLSMVPFNLLPTASALVWGTGVTYNCDNEYYSTTTPLTVDNLTISTHWFSVNGLGWNITYAGTKTYENLSSIQSNPTTSTGYIMNWTSTRIGGGTIYYNISGLKPSHDYILYAQSSPFPHTTTAGGCLEWSSSASSRVYQIYDEGGEHTTWYVSTSGSDSNSGTSSAAPWQTIAKVDTEMGVAGVINPGDSVLFKCGDTFTWSTAGGRLTTLKSGVDRDNPTLIGSYDTGAKPIFTTTSVYSCIYITDTVSNITIQGINFTQQKYYQISFENNCSDIIVEDCMFYDKLLYPTSSGSMPSVGFYDGCHDIIFRNNEMYWPNDAYSQNGMDIWGCYQVLVENNSFIGPTHSCVSIYGVWDKTSYDDDVYYCEYRDVIVRNNTFVTNRRAVDIGFRQNHTLIENNTVLIVSSAIRQAGSEQVSTAYHCIERFNIWEDVQDTRGFDIRCGDGTYSQGPEYVTVYHNTIYSDYEINDYDQGVIDAEIVGAAIYDIKNFSVLNNIIYCPHVDNFRVASYLDWHGTYGYENCEFANNIMMVGDVVDDMRIKVGTVTDYTLAYCEANSPMNGVSFYDNINETPEVNTTDFTLPIWSNCINVGRYLTNTTAAATSATIQVNQSYHFYPQVTIRDQTLTGDIIFVGGDQNLEVIAVDPDAQTITVNRSITYLSGETVSLQQHYNNPPDIGAYENTEASVPPTVENPYPASDATDVPYPVPYLRITCNDTDADTMNVYFRTNASGSWADLSSNLTVTNGTFYSTTTTLFSGFDTQYWWSVNCTDSHGNWTNITYNFTTRATYTPEGPTGFTSTTLSRSQIWLNWTDETGVDYAYIRYKSGATSPISRTDGTYLCNITGISTTASSLSHNTQYSFSIWGYNATDHVWNDAYGTTTNTTLSNQAPSFAYINPANNSINQELSVSWSAYLSDPEGDVMVWSFECSNGQDADGFGTGNDTQATVFSGLSYSTTYKVWVNVTDLYAAHTSRWYQFTTKASPYSNTPPVISNPSPSNGSILQPLYPDLSVLVSDANGNSTTVNWYNNKTGSWVLFQTNNTVTANTTVRCDAAPFASSSDTRYWWRVTAYDGHDTSSSIYNFRTQPIEAEIGDPYNIHANWTTATNLNITWTLGANTTATRITRKTGSYPTGPGDGTTVYNGSGIYVNLTVSPATYYYYTAYGRNGTSYSNGINIIVAWTENVTNYGASWLEFPGYLATDRTTQVHFDYAYDPSYSTVTIYDTTLEASYEDFSETLWDQLLGSSDSGQSFLTGPEVFYIEHVGVYAKRGGYPGMLYCSVYAVGADHLPTGSALSTGSINANTFSTTGDWVNITMENYTLSADTRYAFVLSMPGVGYPNTIQFRWSDNGFADGSMFNGKPGTYANQTGWDLLFRVWGLEVNSSTFYTTTSETLSSSDFFNITQSSLVPGMYYYYRSRANDSEGDTSRGNTRYSLTNPGPPIYLTMTPDFGASTLNISWIEGTGAERTLVVRGTTDFPDAYDDGEVMYNGTGNYTVLADVAFNESYKFSLFSYCTELGLHRYSAASAGATIAWGGVSFNCFNESSGLPINFSVLVSNQAGDDVYYGPDLSGWQFINTTEIPIGEKIGFYVSDNTTGNKSYNSRMYYYDIESEVFYNFSFYLPPANESYLYNLQVVEQYQTEYTTANVPVGDVNIIIKRYMISTDSFETIASLVTDATGVATVSLIPEVYYKVYLSKDGYEDGTGDYIPVEPNLWGQTETKIFTIVRLYDELNTSTGYNPVSYITFTATWGVALESGDRLYVYFNDTSGFTTEGYIRLYRNGTDLNWTGTLTDSEYLAWLSGLNHTLYDYKLVLYIYNHSMFYNYTDVRILPRYHAGINIGPITFDLPDLSTVILENPLGWLNSILFFLGVVVMVTFGRTWAGIAIMGLGALIFMFQFVFGFPVLTIGQLSVIPLFFMYGVFVQISKGKKETRF